MFFFSPCKWVWSAFCLFVCLLFLSAYQLSLISFWQSCWGVKEVQCNYWHLNFILNGYLQTRPKQIIDPNLLLLQPTASLWWDFDANWHRILFCCSNVGSNLSLWHSWSPHLAWQAEIICVYLPYSSLLHIIQIFHLYNCMPIAGEKGHVNKACWLDYIQDRKLKVTEPPQ